MSQWASQSVLRASIHMRKNLPCWEKSYFKRGIKDGRSLRKTSNRWCMWRVWIQAEASPSGARAKRLKVWLTIHLQFIIHSDNVKKWQFSHRASIYPTDPSPSTTGDIQSVNTAHLHHTVYVSLSLWHTAVKHCGHSSSGLYFSNLHGCVRPSECHRCLFFLLDVIHEWLTHWASKQERATRSRQGCGAWSQGKLKRERGRKRNVIFMHHWC